MQDSTPASSAATATKPQTTSQDLIAARLVEVLSGLDPAPSGTQHGKLVRKPVDFVEGAFLLKNVLSEEECDALIPLVKALVQVGRQDFVEKAQRAAAKQQKQAADQASSEDGNAADTKAESTAATGSIQWRRQSQHHTPVRPPATAMASLASRVRDYLPPTAGPTGKASRCPLETPGSEVSAFLRLYDYKQGEYSAPHFDRSFTEVWKKHELLPLADDSNDTSAKDGTASGSSDRKKPKGKVGGLKYFSAYSLLLYLNDDFEGGCTTFLLPPTDEKTERTCGGNTPTGDVNHYSKIGVVPCKGDCLVFPHGRTVSGLHPDPLHEGSVVESGSKTIIRTDLHYAMGA